MSFPVSPGINFREIDLSTAVAEQISSNGSFAGQFGWGPAYEVTRVGSEDDLVRRFGKPTSTNFVDFFVASSFLSYSSALDIVRVVSRQDAKNAVIDGLPTLVANNEEYDAGVVNLAGITLIAKYPGVYGNSIGVSYVVSPTQYSGTFPGVFAFARSSTLVYTPSAAETLSSLVSVGDSLVVDGTSYEIAAIDGNNLILTRIYAGPLTPLQSQVSYSWKYARNFGLAPTSNQVYVVIYDADGKITSQAGTVVETFVGTKTVGERGEDGTLIFIDEVLKGSQFVRPGALSLATTPAAPKAFDGVMIGGVDGAVSLNQYIDGYQLFGNKEEVTAPLIIAGASGVTGKGASSDTTLANYIIQNIAEVRKDSVVFVSPGVQSVFNNRGNEVVDLIETRKKLAYSSYATMDTGWKYMFDRYNNVFRWVPLCGDHAGIYSRVDREREPWFAAAGPERGLIKNVVKLAFNPSEQDRDRLYPQDINPVYNVPGVGPAVFGAKTLLGKNSVFSRVQTRRLFIILEQTIVDAAKNLMFEFNDEFTQNRFVSIVEPFLRDVKGRRGIEDFAVIADSSVNTPQVVQNNRFVGQIYIKPLYSIEFIRLDFVAVGASVEFNTVIGTV